MTGWDPLLDGASGAVLDDPDALAAGDPGDMLRAVASGGAQVRSALRGVAETDLAPVLADGRPRALVVAGMGGSGVAADVVGAVAGVTCPVPVVSVKGHRLPGWVGPVDLVVGVSCSGRTAETLAVTDEALRRGARVVTVGCAGSPLAERAAGGRALHLAVDPGDRMPRSNLWTLSVPVLALADQLGLVSAPAPVLEQVADALDRTGVACGPATDTAENPAKRLALGLAGSIPLIWGSSELAGVAAHRFASQLAENAKYPAVDGVLPEVLHNQVVALAGAFGAAGRSADDLFRDPVEDGPDPLRLRVVLLRDTDELPEVTEKRTVLTEVAEEYGVVLDELVAEGDHPVLRLASLLGPTDFASVYLALLQGIDPTPIAPITALKEHARP